jgi:hypothetical protein
MGQSLLPVTIYVVLRVILDQGSPTRAHATLESLKTSGIRRLILIITGTGLVALSCSFVRFPVTALGISGTIFKACSLLLLECSLSYNQDERDHAPNATNGLLLKPVPRVEDHAQDDIRVARDLAGVVALLCFLLSISFESLRNYDMIYRPQQGPVDSMTEQLPPVKTIYYNWDVGADAVGILFETAKAFAMLFMVCLIFLSSSSKNERF